MELNVDLQNCYGIRELKETFSFDANHIGGMTYCIYASNATMKTSFSKTLQDYANGNESGDLLRPNLLSSRTIMNGNGDPIEPEDIFVVQSYDGSFQSDKISVLLANRTLRKEYETIVKTIDESKERVVAKVAATVNLKPNLAEKEIISAYGAKDIYDALEYMYAELAKGNAKKYGDLNYDDIFNLKTEKLLNDPKITRELNVYAARFEALTTGSKIFRKNLFDHTQAKDVSNMLDKNNYFKAGHAVLLRNGDKTEQIDDTKDLEKLIEEEKRRIMNDEKILASFKKIDDKIAKNAETKKFRSYIVNHQEIIPELLNPKKLKQEIFAGVFAEDKGLLEDFFAMLSKSRKQIETVMTKAAADTTLWEKVVDKFNCRFFVPFRVRIGNQKDVILKEAIPIFEFVFKDEKGSEQVDKNLLVDILSTGEKRALYLLNILFEIEARRNSAMPQLLIFDDIADSFDYKNKYAILEYLKDISDSKKFCSIILTHNFDFYRSLESRKVASRDRCLVARKEEKKIVLARPDYVKNPYEQLVNETDDAAAFISVIPFCRNLIEFRSLVNDANSGMPQDYAKLTSALHAKPYTETAIIQDFLSIISREIAGYTTNIDSSQNYLDLLYETAREIIANESKNRLEHKMVLSIASRIKAEEYMINKIADPDFVEEIGSNQTRELYKKYLELPNRDSDVAKLLEEVNILTPDLIHVNTFMFEPLVDVSIDALRKLYKKLSELEA